MPELGKAYVQIVPSAEGISGSIQEAIAPESKKAGESAGLNIAGGISSALKGATTLIASGVAAVSTGILKGTSDLASYGDNIDKMSQKMGLSAQAYQEWDAVMQHSGTSMEAMKSSMKTLANAAETNSKAFELLGISQQELTELSQEELFEKTIAALQNVEDETQRTYLAGKTLGKGATELGALLNTSAEDTQAMRDRVRELGGVMSDDAVKSAALFQDNMQDLQTAMSGLTRGMMSELLPGMNSIISGFTSLILGEEGATEALNEGFNSLFESVGKIADDIIEMLKTMAPTIISAIGSILPQLIQTSTELIISLANTIAESLPDILPTLIPAIVTSAIAIITAFGEAILGIDWISLGMDVITALADSLDQSGFNILSGDTSVINSFLAGITNNLGPLLAGGSSMLIEVLNGILSNLPQMLKGASQLIMTFASFIMQNLPTILKSGIDILKSVASGILQALPTLIETVIEVLDTFLKNITDNLPLVVEEGLALLSSLIQGILDNLPLLVECVLSLIFSIISTIAANLPSILQQGVLLISNIVSGIVQMIPQVISSVINLIGQVVRQFTSFDWGSVGRNLIQGVANGISSAVGMIVDAAKNAARAAFDAAKSFLGINSPATKGIYLGDMYDEGIAVGVEKNINVVEKSTDTLMNDAFSDLKAPMPSYDFTPIQNNQTSGDTIINMEINAADGMDVIELAELVAERINFNVKQKELAYA